MKVTLQPVARWPKIPIWVMGFVALWVAVASLARVVGHFTGSEPNFCLFSRFTHYPSPTCGTTRGILALARGDLRASFAWNPLAMSLGALGTLALGARAATARTLYFQLSRWEKRVFMAIAIAAFLVNWAWLLYSQRGLY